MDLTIIGAGNMGRAIGTRVLAGGSNAKILDNDPAEAKQLADELSAAASEGGTAEGGAAGDSLSGDVVVLAVWYEPARSVIEQYGDQLDGKVVVDITNPVDTTSFDGLVTPADSSAAEELAKLAPSGARLVKAFNTTFAGTLVEGQVGGQPLDVLIAGDDESAKETVAELVRAGGLNAIDAGPLKRARELEALGFLHMALQEKLGTGYGSAVKIIS
ncbi:MAG TPA: NAD(P)-binding domain-containing protein [Solirubrobacterales bacterium]|nr:NAD(P)-binding domain-containing protein [Solirubrobacterales bacterium]